MTVPVMILMTVPAPTSVEVMKDEMLSDWVVNQYTCFMNSYFAPPWVGEVL